MDKILCYYNHGITKFAYTCMSEAEGMGAPFVLEMTGVGQEHKISKLVGIKPLGKRITFYELPGQCQDLVTMYAGGFETSKGMEGLVK